MSESAYVRKRRRPPPRKVGTRIGSDRQVGGPGLVELAQSLSDDLFSDERWIDLGASYQAHRRAVADLVRDHGGRDEQVAAALLIGPAVGEDSEAVASIVAARLPDHPEVTRIVAAVAGGPFNRRPYRRSRSSAADRERWRSRDEDYLLRLAEQNHSVLLVAAADALNVCRLVVTADESEPNVVWELLRVDLPQMLWCLDWLASICSLRLESDLSAILRTSVDDIADRASRRQPAVVSKVDSFQKYAHSSMWRLRWSPGIDADGRQRLCPRCGGNGLSIVYGDVEGPLESDEPVFLGGCVLSEADRGCEDCGHMWSSTLDAVGEGDFW